MSRSRQSYLLISSAGLVFGATLLLAGPLEPNGNRRQKPNEYITVPILMETLDAIQSELLTSGVCKGGEQIELWLELQDKDPQTVNLYYAVPNQLDIFREAYVQADGTVLLADDLAFRDRQTRFSIQTVDDRGRRERQTFSTHISAMLPRTIGDDVKARQERRVQLAKKLLQAP